MFYCILLYSTTIPRPFQDQNSTEQYITGPFHYHSRPFQAINPCGMTVLSRRCQPGNKPLRDDRSIPTLPGPIPGTHPVKPCSIGSKIGRKSRVHTLFYPDAASPIITSTLILKCRSMFLDPTVKSFTRPFPELYKALWGAS